MRWLALALVLAAGVAAFGFGRLPGEMRDFEVYWTAGGRALQGEPLYRADDGHYQFKYLPAFATLFSPVALVSLTAARQLWFVISVAMLAALIWLSVVLLPQRRRAAGFIVAVIVVAMAKFYGHELVLGQVNLVFGVLVASALLALSNRQDALAGALVVTAVVVKPYAVLFLPWLLIAGRTPALITAVAGVGLVLALSALTHGPAAVLDLHLQWWTTVTESTAPNLTNNDNVSLAGFSAKWLGATPAATMLTGAGSLGLLLLVALVVWMRRGIAAAHVLEGALILTIIPLVSPQGWDYVFLIATPAVALFANYDDRLPPALRWTTWIAVATIGLSLFDLMGRERYAAFMSWSIITLCFLVLVAALTMLRVRRVA